MQPLRAASKSKDCCYNPDSPGHDRPGPGTVLKKFLGPRSGISQNGCGCPCNSLACVRSPPPHETPRTLNRRERLGVCFLNKIVLPVPEAGNRLISTVVGWSWGTSYPGRLKIRCTRAVILLLFLPLVELVCLVDLEIFVYHVREVELACSFHLKEDAPGVEHQGSPRGNLVVLILQVAVQ